MAGPRNSSPFRIAVLLAAALSLAACGGVSYTPIDITDSRSSVQSARLTWQLSKPALAQGTEQILPEAASAAGSLELQYTRFRGEQDQDLAAGSAMAVGGKTIIGPQDLHHRFDIAVAQVALTSNLRFSQKPTRFELDFSLGLGLLDLSLRTDGSVSGADALRKDDRTGGVVFGFGARQWLGGVAGLEGRVFAVTPNPLVFIGGSFGDGQYDEAWGGEAALIIAPLDHLWLRGGFAVMEYTARHESGSTVAVKASGPFVGLQVAF